MSLCVIHLSDIHIKTAEDLIFNRLDSLCKACASAVTNGDDVVIAISGDIAFSGKKEQYVLATDLIVKIQEYLEKEKDANITLVMTPGNHDCDFNNQDGIRQTLVEEIRRERIDKDYFENVVRVQSNYFEFISLFDGMPIQLTAKKEIEINGNKILFLPVNTAWMSTLKEVPGKVIMPSNLYESIDSQNYKIVFYMAHHPMNWLDPKYKNEFIEYVRKNADILLLGHEHTRDSYQQIGDDFSFFSNHGKELQNSDGEDSAFSVFCFDEAFQTYTIKYYSWAKNKYVKVNAVTHQFHKNIASQHSIFRPNSIFESKLMDAGIVINHFAKDDVILPDLFVWPYLKRLDYNENKRPITIQSEIPEELFFNHISILTGASTAGKTSMAKMLYLKGIQEGNCCILIDGSEFTSSDVSNIENIVEKHFVRQYSQDFLDEFRLLPKSNKIILIDNFDNIKSNKNRRNMVVDYLSETFDKVILFMTSSIDITSIISSKAINALSEVFYYDILPLGNKKRKELVSKWYYLGEDNLSDEEIDDRIEKSIHQIDTLLGNGAAILPALPIFIIGTLQNRDAMKPLYGNSRYAILYETLILSALTKISIDYVSSGEYNIHNNILSELSFNMLTNKYTGFSEGDLIQVVNKFQEEKMFPISHYELLNKMISAQIIYKDLAEGGLYRFKYPYIFYYFAGRYIARHLNEDKVKKVVEYMSTKLYNETYGNIIIFVCHFSNSKEIIDNILLNAYDTLSNYVPFDFTKSNSIFGRIHETLETLIPKSIGDNDVVEENKGRALERLDAAGINDGQVNEGETEIDDEISEQEKDVASVASAFKTLEVLGQILQNYPGDIDGTDKIIIIDEMHKLGMRSVQAIIDTMGYIEQELVDYIVEKTRAKNANISREDIVAETKRFINYLISGTVRGMVHQVAQSLNSIYLLQPVEKVLSEDSSISSKLILMDLKLNCLNRFSYREVSDLKKSFSNSKEIFAENILGSIVGYYLNYNKCDHALRSKLCSLCGISERQALIDHQTKLLN